MISGIPSYLPTFVLHSFWQTPQSNPEQTVFAGLSNLHELAQVLKGYQLADVPYLKREIQIFIQSRRDNFDEIDQFLTSLMEWGTEKDPTKILDILSELIDLELLSTTISKKVEFKDSFKNIFDWAQKVSPFCPMYIHPPRKSILFSELKAASGLIRVFISQVIGFFLSFTKFFKHNKNSLPLWDQYLHFEILCKLFLVPYGLFKILQPLLGITQRVYLIAIGVIVVTGFVLKSYSRWRKMVPDEIVNCTNLDKQMEKGVFDLKVGQAQELRALTAALEGNENVLLIGPSGGGKTALVQHLIQAKHHGELSKQLSELSFFEVDCGLMISSMTFGHSQLINQTKDEIEGCEEKVLLVFDEFYQVATNQAAFLAFKKRFLEDKPNSKFIAIMTLKEYEQIKNLDIDGSFQRRVSPIRVQSSSDQQNRVILQEMISRTAAGIPVADDAIATLLEVANDDQYLAGIGKPAKVIKILNDAIGICKNSFNPNFKSVELLEAQQKYQGLKQQAIQEIRLKPQTLADLEATQQEIQSLEKEMASQKEQVLKIKDIHHYQKNLKEYYFRMTHRLTKEKFKEKDQILYLLTYFYGFDSVKKTLQNEIDCVKSIIPVQINQTLIRQVFEQAKEVGKELLENPGIEAEVEGEGENAKIQGEEENIEDVVHVLEEGVVE